MAKNLRLGGTVEYRDNDGVPHLAFIVATIASEPFSSDLQSARLKVVPANGDEYYLDAAAQGEGPGTFSVL